MKIFAFVDMHGSLKAMRKIKKKIKKHKPDVLVCAGDISIFGQNLDFLVHTFSRFKIPLFIVHGNHESVSEMNKSASLAKNVHFIHEKTFRYGDVMFMGYGGGGFSIVDKHFLKVAKKFDKKIKKNGKTVLITHGPPYKTRLDKIMDSYCGNKSYTNFIKKSKLSLVICGHIHENAGREDHLGGTRMVNPGPYGKIIRI